MTSPLPDPRDAERLREGFSDEPSPNPCESEALSQRLAEELAWVIAILGRSRMKIDLVDAVRLHEARDLASHTLCASLIRSLESKTGDGSTHKAPSDDH